MSSGLPLHSRILGTGAYAPERVLSNHHLEKMVETTDEWIRERTGIRERRIAAEGESTSDMALAAARRALEMAGLSPRDLDMIIVGTVTADTPMPACAAFLQQKLGADRHPRVRRVGRVRGLLCIRCRSAISSSARASTATCSSSAPSS